MYNTLDPFQLIISKCISSTHTHIKCDACSAGRLSQNFFTISELLRITPEELCLASQQKAHRSDMAAGFEIPEWAHLIPAASDDAETLRSKTSQLQTLAQVAIAM